MAYVEDRLVQPTGEGQARLRLVSADWQSDQPLTGWFETSRWGTWLRELSWSPAGRWLAFQRYSKGAGSWTMYAVNVDTGEMRFVGDDVVQLAWSPQDPSRLAFFTGKPTPEGGLSLSAVDSLENPQRVELAAGVYVASLAWHPDGTQLVLCTCDDWVCKPDGMELWIVDVASLSGRLVYDRAPRCGGFAWSPDGVWLANYGQFFGGGRDSILFYETAGWTVARKQPGGDAFDGRWFGAGLVLYAEETNMQGGPSTGTNDSYQLVAVSVESSARKLLWSPRAVGLPERIQGKLGIFKIAWHMPSEP